MPEINLTAWLAALLSPNVLITILPPMSSKIGRNQPCLCGSGRKFKKCCGRIVAGGSTAPQRRQFLERHQAAEHIRQGQQGLGRPIIALKSHGHQLVAVRNTLHWSPTWKTFPDFLADYIKRVIGADWGNAEIAKPFEQRHTLMQWYDTFCRYQQATIPKPGEITEAPINGVVACYLGLAYSLYLLDHNVELQDRLVRRLKDPANFQGAYYELMVANILVRAGFTLTLQDETDGASKHCEFAAISKRTGKRYWVEAKMRSVSGLFGKTDADGGNDRNPLSRMIPHLNQALAKPAADERLIFIDINGEPDVAERGKPAWIEPAAKRLEQYEAKELPVGTQAYVFVTNMSYHRSLHGPPAGNALPFGLGMPDFNRPGFMRLREAHALKQKHIDAHHIGEMFGKYLQFPSTFDGRLPSEVFGKGYGRILIGETYRFGDGESGEIVGTVTSACVSEEESRVYIAVTDDQGRAQILSQPLSSDELADYRANKEAYFGRIQSVGRKITSRQEFFDHLMEIHKHLSREELLSRLAAAPDVETLRSGTDDGLLAAYCEGMVAAFEASGFKTDEVS